GSVGIATCGSPAAPPRPGKCFSVAPTPPSCRPATAAATDGATTPGDEPNDRSPMMASRGFVRTSATGARFKPTPAAARPNALRFSSARTLSGPPRAITLGQGGAESVFTFDTKPPSWSSITRIGCSAQLSDVTALMRSVHDFKSAGKPPKFGVNSNTPPTWLRASTGLTALQSRAPRQENTITAPMSASRSHDADAGRGEASGSNDGDGDVIATAKRASDGRPTSTNPASTATTTTNATR